MNATQENLEVKLATIQEDQRKRKALYLKQKEDKAIRRKKVCDLIDNLRNKGVGVNVIHFRLVKAPYKFKSDGTLAQVPFAINDQKYNADVIEIPVEMPIFEIRRRKLQNHLLSYGGYTTVRLFADGKTAMGEAQCHNHDLFDRHYALELAVNRAASKWEE